MTTLVILQCLVVLLLFVIYGKLTENKKDEVNNNNIQLTEPQKIELYKNGARENWLITNVCLYKMWEELDILDYESLKEKLQRNLEELTSKPEVLNEWREKFNDYIKE